MTYTTKKEQKKDRKKEKDLEIKWVSRNYINYVLLMKYYRNEFIKSALSVIITPSRRRNWTQVSVS